MLAHRDGFPNAQRRAAQKLLASSITRNARRTLGSRRLAWTARSGCTSAPPSRPVFSAPNPRACGSD